MHFPFSLLPTTIPNPWDVEKHPGVLEIADFSCKNLFHPVVAPWFDTILVSDADFQVFLVRHPVSFHCVVVAGNINEERFFQEYVATSLNGGSVLPWAKARRSANQNFIAGIKTGDCFLVGIKTMEDAIIREVNLSVQYVFRVAAIGSEGISCSYYIPFKGVGKGNNLDVVSDQDTISDRSVAASAAADQSKFD